MSRYFNEYEDYDENSLEHHGVLGMKWGVRHYQNSDGSLTSAGKRRYYANSKSSKKIAKGYERHLNDLDEEGAYQDRHGNQIKSKINSLNEKNEKYLSKSSERKSDRYLNKVAKNQAKINKLRNQQKLTEQNLKKSQIKTAQLLEEATDKGYDINGEWGTKQRNAGYIAMAGTVGAVASSIAIPLTTGYISAVNFFPGAIAGTGLANAIYGPKQGRVGGINREDNDTYYKVSKHKGEGKGTARYIEIRDGDVVGSTNALEKMKPPKGKKVK